jgi:hypothetical protein
VVSVLKGRSWLRLAALAAIVGIGTVLRIGYALAEPMRVDESYTYNEYATRPLYDVVSLYTFPNNHLFHTALVYVSIRLFGSDPWAIRLPALVAGIALIPATYVLVSRFADARAGVWASALVAVSEPLVSYSADGRGYSILGLITVLTVATAHRLRNGGRAVDWVAFTVLPALGFFTIPIMLYPYSGILVWLLLSKLSGRAQALRVDRLILSVGATGLLTFLLYTPTVGRVGWRAVTSNPFVRPVPRAEVVRGLPEALRQVWAQWNRDIPTSVVVVFVAAPCLALLGRERDRVIPIAGVTLALFVCTLALIVYLSRLPFERVWLFLLPLYWGLVASGLSTITERILQGRAGGASLLAEALSVLVCVMLGFLVVRSGSIREASNAMTVCHGNEVARQLKPLLDSDTAVISELPCDSALKYYFLTNGLPVEPLYDYRIARARRLFIVVNRPSGQTPQSVLTWNKIQVPAGREPKLFQDYGTSALYELDR